MLMVARAQRDFSAAGRRPVRVAVISPWCCDDGSFMEQEIRAMRSAGLEVAVIAPALPPGIPLLLSQALFVCMALPRLIAAWPHVVFGYSSAYGGLVGLISLWPYSVHELACPADRYVRGWFGRFVARLVHRNATAVRVVSESIRGEVESWSGREAVVVGCVAWSDD